MQDQAKVHSSVVHAKEAAVQKEAAEYRSAIGRQVLHSNL